MDGRQRSMMSESQPSLRKSKHQQIYESLSADIRSRKFAAGDKLPAETELAAEFGTSRPTAARAVRELVRQGLVVRRVGAGTFVREQVTEDREVIGLLVPTLGDSEIFDPICRHIGRRLHSAGHSLVWGSDEDSEHQRLSAAAARQACQRFIESGVSGVFVVPFLSRGSEENPNQEIVSTLVSAGVQVVLLDRDVVSYPQRSPHDLVTVDHMRGTVELTEHLISLGHQRLNFWVSPEPADTMQLRQAGIQLMASRHRLPFGPEYVHCCDPQDQDAVVSLLQEHRPSAIICQNDVYAAHLLRTLFSQGIRVPEDVSVTGYDDVHYSSLLHVALTTVAQPCEQLGVAAVEVMLNRLRHPDVPARETVLPPQLVVRESTAPPADGRRPNPDAAAQVSQRPT